MTTARMTAEEYFLIAGQDDRWTELVGGEYVINEPNVPHGMLQHALHGALYVWERRVPGVARALGTTNVVLSESDVFGPDLLVVDHVAEVDERNRLAKLPLIVVEIRSPSTWHRDVGRKKSAYEEAGVPELWLVDGLARCVLVFRRSKPTVKRYDIAMDLDERGTLTTPLLPGFALPLAELFA